MAEIPIQRKHGINYLPWLLGLLALLLVLWMFEQRAGRRTAAAVRDTTVSGGAIANPIDTTVKSQPR